ncbi:MAG TPA: biotin synthase BioB [Acidimicrobiales bacterium]|nr:biotin synthase BioB [Acidimicrobiales bacterium]
MTTTPVAFRSAAAPHASAPEPPSGPPPAPQVALSAADRAVIAGAEKALLDERRPLTGDELGALAALPDGAVMNLAALAHQVRLAWCGPEVEVEGILSAKTGGCPEDCHFCSQSSRFDTPVKATPFLDRNEVLAAARETAALGASEFCIVLAVRGPDERTLQRILDLVPLIHAETGLNVAVSAGILTEEQARRLAEGGVHRYNHNVETARSFFPSIVTTHTWDERADTCRLIKSHGMELCCGALLNMGETDAQRVELLTQLQELEPTEVPLNFLNPRPGTPLGDRPILGAWEAVRWIALFRLALPAVILRYAGGREVTLRDLQAIGMTAGINALIVGNYLTTLGRSADDDLQMLEDLRMPIGALSAAI